MIKNNKNLNKRIPLPKYQFTSYENTVPTVDRTIDPFKTNKSIFNKASNASRYLTGGITTIGQGLSTYYNAKNPDFAVRDSLVQTGLGTAQVGALNYATDSGNMSQGAAGAFNAGSAVSDAAGSAISSEGNEELGGALSGAGKGVATGAAIGSVVPGFGTAIGAVAGGVIGGAMGLWGGTAKRKARLERERKERKAKALRKEQENRRQLEMQISNTANKYDEYGHRIARNGLEINTKFKLKTSENKTLKPIANTKKITKFKRGGEIQLSKENIIPDGVTHGRLNKTSVTKDKGLPVVYDGEKKVEIEKEELVLNSRANRMAKIIYNKYNKESDKDKDKDKHLIALGKLMSREILNNTYDYTKKFNINKGKPIKDKPEEIESRPKEGNYKIKEVDIKAEAGKMQVLGNNGEVLCNISDKTRIISRKHTKKLVELAKKGKNKEAYKKLGKYMYKVLDIQKNQKDQYV